MYSFYDATAIECCENETINEKIHGGTNQRIEFGSKHEL